MIGSYLNAKTVFNSQSDFCAKLNKEAEEVSSEVNHHFNIQVFSFHKLGNVPAEALPRFEWQIEKVPV